MSFKVTQRFDDMSEIDPLLKGGKGDFMAAVLADAPDVIVGCGALTKLADNPEIVDLGFVRLLTVASFVC